jgi:hypothetical protein
MKKLFSIFLAVIFLASAMGMNIHSHFCGKKLEYVGVVKHNCCCKKKSTMPKDCCKNEIKTVKLTDDFTTSESQKISKQNFSITVFEFLFTAQLQNSSDFSLVNYHSPPLKTDRVVVFHSLLI